MPDPRAPCCGSPSTAGCSTRPAGPAWPQPSWPTASARGVAPDPWRQHGSFCVGSAALRLPGRRRRRARGTGVPHAVAGWRHGPDICVSRLERDPANPRAVVGAEVVRGRGTPPRRLPRDRGWSGGLVDRRCRGRTGCLCRARRQRSPTGGSAATPVVVGRGRRRRAPRPEPDGSLPEARKGARALRRNRVRSLAAPGRTARRRGMARGREAGRGDRRGARSWRHRAGCPLPRLGPARRRHRWWRAGAPVCP